MLWRKIEKELPFIDRFDEGMFDRFYGIYCLFCTNRRKIPLIRHKELKVMKTTPEINTVIEKKRG